MLICVNCDLSYEVVYNLDAAAMDGDVPNQYCPRCGHDDVEDMDHAQ